MLASICGRLSTHRGYGVAHRGKLLVSALKGYGFGTVLLYRPRQWPQLRQCARRSTVYKGGRGNVFGPICRLCPWLAVGVWWVGFCFWVVWVGGLGGCRLRSLPFSSPSLTRTPGVHSRIRREKTPRKKNGLVAISDGRRGDPKKMTTVGLFDPWLPSIFAPSGRNHRGFDSLVCDQPEVTPYTIQDVCG